MNAGESYRGWELTPSRSRGWRGESPDGEVIYMDTLRGLRHFIDQLA